MSELIDGFGRTIISDDQGNYTCGGMTLVTDSDEAALNTFNGMAPEGWIQSALSVLTEEEKAQLMLSYAQQIGFQS